MSDILDAIRRMGLELMRAVEDETVGGRRKKDGGAPDHLCSDVYTTIRHAFRIQARALPGSAVHQPTLDDPFTFPRYAPMKIPPAALTRFNTFLNTIKLMEKDGGLFIISARHRMSSSDSDTRDICLRENDHNKFYFDHTYSGDPYADFLTNRWFAQGAMARLQYLLKRDFPNRQAVLFVLNEITPLANEDEELIAVKLYPSVRLWTAGAEGDQTLRSLRLADHAAPETAWHRISEKSCLLPIKDLDFSCPFLGLKDPALRTGRIQF